MAESEEEQMFVQHAGRDHYYNPAANAAGGYLPGVPSRDLDAAEWDALPAQQRREALHQGWWRLTPVPAPKSDETPAPKGRAARATESVATQEAPDGGDQ